MWFSYSHTWISWLGGFTLNGAFLLYFTVGSYFHICFATQNNLYQTQHKGKLNSATKALQAYCCEDMMSAIFFCQSELKGVQTTWCYQRLPHKLYEFALDGWLLKVTTTTTTKTESRAACFAPHVPKGILWQTVQNPEKTKYILNSPKSTSGNEIHSLIRTLLCCSSLRCKHHKLWKKKEGRPTSVQ